MDLIAHKTEEGLEQTLSEHLKNVAERSAFFAESFCVIDVAPSRVRELKRRSNISCGNRLP